jgi:hypothetical protein
MNFKVGIHTRSTFDDRGVAGGQGPPWLCYHPQPKPQPNTSKHPTKSNFPSLQRFSSTHFTVSPIVPLRFSYFRLARVYRGIKIHMYASSAGVPSLLFFSEREKMWNGIPYQRSYIFVLSGDSPFLYWIDWFNAMVFCLQCAQLEMV